ncbi:hypothetical protein [Streptomyces albipurpureus]|uniref:Uncharacterized protein n=1 Tax=Streptomyces albipurpureus TaxID=2897419 RepID=A0ABT0UT48_9ACTN|nr:hypothetical protein [Streptomyces sp. CWNU-1]MCM2391728.1 hypothetical protein [Streptomyces sp. CWNU-1]
MSTQGDAVEDPALTVVTVTLFKASGKFYTSEEWRIPTQEQIDDAAGKPRVAYPFIPHCMRYSPDFRRISGGAVLVDTQEPWGYPHLFPGESA